MQEVRVSRVDDVTPRIRSFELVAADGGDLPAFAAGAHIDMALGNGEERSYSLLNDPAETHRYQIAVLREAESRGGSSWMHDALRAGDILRVSEPTNDFPLYEGGEFNVLIAGGIGITPIMSMAARLIALGKDYRLHYCARSRQEAAFIDELELLHGTRLVTHFDGGNPAMGIDLKALLAKRPPAGHVYVCGPIGLIRATRAAAVDWPQGTAHHELFKGSEADLAPESNNQPFEVMLKKSGKTYTIPADKSILSVLKAEGYKIKTLCTKGTCGTCRVTYLSGHVEHRDDVLDDDEKASVLQVCVSRGLPGETLVLDL